MRENERNVEKAKKKEREKGGDEKRIICMKNELNGKNIFGFFMTHEADSPKKENWGYFYSRRKNIFLLTLSSLEYSFLS